jgi:hypothetical protein
LDNLPYTIGFLGFVVGARERIDEQFASAPVSKHQRATLSLCLPGPLNDAMNAMQNPYDLEDDEFRWCVVSIREMPFNDDVCETSHAEFAGEHRRANASTFGWKATLVRLAQNIADMDLLSSATGVNLQSVYDNHKQSIQTKSRHRPVRCSRKVFEDTLYRCNLQVSPSVAIVCDSHVQQIFDNFLLLIICVSFIRMIGSITCSCC